jgi:hypothetical protein
MHSGDVILMNARTVAQTLLVLVLVGVAIGVGVTAYNAGVSAGLAQNGNVTIVPGYPGSPYVGAGYGVGFGHFGFFGFFGGLLFLFLLFGLIRAAFGRGHRRGGYGHGWSGGWRDGEGRSWEDRARETHDSWHRAHPDQPDRPAGS